MPQEEERRMRWQREVRDILEKANWPPRAVGLATSPWPRIIALAILGWILAELLSRVDLGAHRRWDRSGAY